MWNEFYGGGDGIIALFLKKASPSPLVYYECLCEAGGREGGVPAVLPPGSDNGVFFFGFLHLCYYCSGEFTRCGQVSLRLVSVLLFCTEAFFLFVFN